MYSYPCSFGLKMIGNGQSTIARISPFFVMLETKARWPFVVFARALSTNETTTSRISSPICGPSWIHFSYVSLSSTSAGDGSMSGPHWGKKSRSSWPRTLEVVLACGTCRMPQNSLKSWQSSKNLPVSPLIGIEFPLSQHFPTLRLHVSRRCSYSVTGSGLLNLFSGM